MAKRKIKLKPIPEFKSEAEEREFWETHDTTEYVDWSKARFVTFPNLKPSTATISLRLPAMLLDELKSLANKRDVPYQSLLKIYLAERVESELREVAGRRAYRVTPARPKAASKSRPKGQARANESRRGLNRA